MNGKAATGSGQEQKRLLPVVVRRGAMALVVPLLAVAAWAGGVPTVAAEVNGQPRDQLRVAERPAAVAVPVVVAEADEGLALARWVGRIGEELLASLEEPDLERGPLRGGLIILSFVDQQKLDRTTSFGRYLAEQLMTELQQQRVPVVELRKSNEVRLHERGEYGLSRDPAEISDRAAAVAMLTGTYTLTGRQVIVNARIIDHASSRLLASATGVIPRLEMVDELLSDPVNISRPRQREPMYMKRL